MKFKILNVNFLIASLMLLGAFTSNAQLKKNIDYSGFFDSYYYHQKYSFVAGLNVPVYFGDICSSLACREITPGFTIGGGIKLWPKVYFGGEFSYFSLGATEKEGRQFSFSSKNYELLALGRYYLIDDIVRKHNDLRKKPKLFKPYVTLGIGLNYINPTSLGVVNDTLYDLNVFEEQSYPKLIMAIPAGVGFQFDISKRVHLIAEGLYRLTLSDYVDGVSTIANPDVDDSYLTFNLKVQYNPFAKRMKRKKRKIDPEKINLQYNSDSTSTTPAKEESRQGSIDENSDYLEEGEIEYNEGVDETQETDLENNTEETEDLEKTTEEEYDEDGFLISEPENDNSEEEVEETYDEGW